MTNPLPDWIAEAKACDQQISEAMEELATQIDDQQKIWDAARDLRAESLKELAKCYDREHTATWADQLLHATGQMVTVGDELYRMRCAMVDLRHASLNPSVL